MARLSGTRSLITFFQKFLQDPSLLHEFMEAVVQEEGNSDVAALREVLNALVLDVDALKNDFVDGYISHIEVIDLPSISIGLFLMAKGTRFPVHDHPSMLGVSHLFSGTISYSSFDILHSNGKDYSYRHSQTGKKSGPFTLYLTPKVGNLHTIFAEEDSVLLDIFVPNYSPERPCTYYWEVSDGVFNAFQPNILFRGADTRLVMLE